MQKQNTRQKTRQHTTGRVFFLLGNTLIALSILGTVITYLPLIQAYIFPKPTTLPPDTTFSIEIEKIQARAPIIEDVDPWNKQAYLEALSHGVAHANNTAMPDTNGTMYLFAHSSDAPWRLTRYNTIFLHLGKLEADDTITIRHEGNEYTYKVTDKTVVWPNEIESLVDAQSNADTAQERTLILQTCAPIGTDLQRLLVFATQI